MPLRVFFFFQFSSPIPFRNRIAPAAVNGWIERQCAAVARILKEPPPSRSLSLSLSLPPLLALFSLSLSQSSSPGVALDGVTASARTNGCYPRQSVDTNGKRTCTHLLSRILEWCRKSLVVSLSFYLLSTDTSLSLSFFSPSLALPGIVFHSVRAIWSIFQENGFRQEHGGPARDPGEGAV